MVTPKSPAAPAASARTGTAPGEPAARSMSGPASSQASGPASGRVSGPAVPRQRLPLMLAGLVSLLAALWGGLLLLGLPVPAGSGTAASHHGVLMTLGFLGTVISLERAVALGRRWAFAAPAVTGAGGVAVLIGLTDAGKLLLCAGSIVLVVVYVVVHRIQPAIHLRVMAAGAVSWYVGAVLWIAGWPVPRIVPWLMGFLVLTILGERLELARVGMLRPASVRQFTAAATVFGAGVVLATVDAAGTAVPGAALGARGVGLGMVLLALWGAANDVARRTVRTAGVTRFMAVCLLSGYVWLAVGGVIWLVGGDLGGALGTYDAGLHAVFLGFVMSMIFGHAPVIVPAVLRVRLPFHPAFYVHLALLHVSLVVRLLAGDALGVTVLWRIGGVGTEVAVVLFLAASATAVLRSRRRSRAP